MQRTAMKRKCAGVDQEQKYLMTTFPLSTFSSALTFYNKQSTQMFSFDCIQEQTVKSLLTSLGSTDHVLERSKTGLFPLIQ